MEALGTLLAVATIIVVVAYIAQPFLAARQGDRSTVSSGGAAQLRARADLLTERNRIYSEIKALDFEHETGKLSDMDYASQRHGLVAQGVDVLQQIDALAGGDDDAIERMVLRLREGEPLTADELPSMKLPEDAAAAVFCAQCGTRAEAGDRFCAKCGAKLS